MSAAKRPRLSLKRPKLANSAPAIKEKTIDAVNCSSSNIIDTNSAPKSTPRLCGLANNGNTCYINVVIQVLRFFPVLMQKLMDMNHDTAEHHDESSSAAVSLSKSLSELFISMNSLETNTDSNSGLVINPTQFVKLIQDNSLLFEQKTQHDTQELLNYVLTTLQQCITITTPTSSPLYSSTTSSNKPLSNKITSFFKPLTPTVPASPPSPAQQPQVPKSVINDLFEGRLRLETKCLNCEESSTVSDNFFNISVPVLSCHSTKRCGPVSLYKAITVATTLEGLTHENKYWCNMCRHLTEGQRCTVITRLPSVMIIHLNRFTTSTITSVSSVMIHKIQGNIAIPTTLCFKQWTNQSCKDKDSLYKLQGVILHTGASCGSGHYTAIVDVGGKMRNKDNWEWVWFDDEKVTCLSHDQLLQMISPLSNSESTPYILFYEKCL